MRNMTAMASTRRMAQQFEERARDDERPAARPRGPIGSPMTGDVGR